MISPGQVAEMAELNLPNVGYHFRVLEKLGALALVNTEPTRGSEAHFYKFTVEEQWALALLDAPSAADGR